MATSPPPGVYPAWPPPDPAPPPVRANRRWLAIGAAAVGGAVLAGSITTALLMRFASAPTVTTSDTITVTAAPSTPQVLPAEQADQLTCHAWRTADPLVTAAALAQGVIPAGMTITSPGIQSNPEWAAGVAKASRLYQQASDTITAGTANGTSRLLADLAATAGAALHTLSLAYSGYDPANGNVMTTFTSAREAMGALCP
jgi:hypothetical protein